MMTITCERTFPNGYWSCSAIVDGRLVRRLYIGYSKREATARFRAEFGEVWS